jgi:hypothetical protein
MYVSAGVTGMATVLPVLEPRVQSHYFLDQPCTLRHTTEDKTFKALFCFTTWKHVDMYVQEHFEL